MRPNRTNNPLNTSRGIVPHDHGNIDKKPRPTDLAGITERRAVLL
jgi:hypothetical protein